MKQKQKQNMLFVHNRYSIESVSSCKTKKALATTISLDRRWQSTRVDWLCLCPTNVPDGVTHIYYASIDQLLQPQNDDISDRVQNVYCVALTPCGRLTTSHSGGQFFRQRSRPLRCSHPTRNPHSCRRRAFQDQE